MQVPPLTTQEKFERLEMLSKRLAKELPLEEALAVFAEAKALSLELDRDISEASKKMEVMVVWQDGTMEPFKEPKR